MFFERNTFQNEQFIQRFLAHVMKNSKLYTLHISIKYISIITIIVLNIRGKVILYSIKKNCFQYISFDLANRKRIVRQRSGKPQKKYIYMDGKFFSTKILTRGNNITRPNDRRKSNVSICVEKRFSVSRIFNITAVTLHWSVAQPAILLGRVQQCSKTIIFELDYKFSSEIRYIILTL